MFSDYYELYAKIMNKELTICETCDNVFDYVRNKRFCDECAKKRKYTTNKEYRREYARKYREKYPERTRAAVKKYREKNKEKIKESNRKYARRKYRAMKREEE